MAQIKSNFKFGHDTLDMNDLLRKSSGIKPHPHWEQLMGITSNVEITLNCIAQENTLT